MDQMADPNPHSQIAQLSACPTQQRPKLSCTLPPSILLDSHFCTFLHFLCAEIQNPIKNKKIHLQATLPQQI